jgi:hypothetical protein
MPQRTDDLRIVDPVLSQIADAYENGTMIADKLWPIVPVSKEVFKVPLFGKNAFVKGDFERALRADSNRVPPPDVDTETSETIEHDVEVSVDNRELDEADNSLIYESRIVKDNEDYLKLEREVDIATFIQNAANYAAGLKKVYTGVDSWMLDATDVIADILAGKEAVRKLIGIEPNTMGIAQDAWLVLKEHATVISRTAGAPLQEVTTAEISRLTEIPNIHIGKAVQTTDAGTTITDVWTQSCVLAFVDMAEKPNRSKWNPSWGYTFQRHTPEVDTYFENGGKIKVFRNTENYIGKRVNASCAYLLDDVLAVP